MKYKTGTLIMISVSHLQLLVGSNTRFFHLPFPAYAKWIESGRLTSIWNFMHRIKFKRHLKDQWCPSLQRQNDIMLMDYYASLKYQPRELKTLNRCRIHLQVYSLADIMAADGKYILPYYKLGELGSDRRSALRWSTQQ
jgi:hypothetical protein